MRLLVLIVTILIIGNILSHAVAGTNEPSEDQHSSNSGTLCYDGASIIQLRKKLSAEAKIRLERSDQDLEQMEVTTLAPFEVHALKHRYEQSPSGKLTLQSQKALDTLQHNKSKLSYQLAYEQRNDRAFWSGAYDAGRPADVPQIGSINIEPIFAFIAKKFKRKNKSNTNR